eukprot:Platyproteum_vivax@DN4509_c0_g1_i1.p1
MKLQSPVKVDKSPASPAKPNNLAAVDPKYAKLQALKDAIEKKKSQRHDDVSERIERSAELEETTKRLHPTSANKLRDLKSEAENEYLRAARKKISLNDFETVKVVGAGAFGAVRLVQRKSDNKVFALKQMPKAMMKNKNQRDRVIAERSVLSTSVSRWIVSLEQTWQDDKNLFMLMEYLPGGDFMSHLIRVDIMNEYDTKFYIAELILAVNTVHQLGYVHRDIKPDNMVLDPKGHLKLLDFGLCKAYKTKDELDWGAQAHAQKGVVSTLTGSVAHPTREHLRSQCGTPNYMAPEVFRRAGYDKRADWWSVGIIAYECLYGGVPFNDANHDVSKIAHKVMNWKKYLALPHPRKQLSSHAIDVLRKLLCEKEDRLDAVGLMKHPFFHGIDWDNLHKTMAPIQPIVKEATDTSNFDFDSSRFDKLPKCGKAWKKDLDYVQYTYNREAEQKKPSINALLQQHKSAGKQ